MTNIAEFNDTGAVCFWFDQPSRFEDQRVGSITYVLSQNSDKGGSGSVNGKYLGFVQLLLLFVPLKGENTHDGDFKRFHFRFGWVLFDSSTRKNKGVNADRMVKVRDENTYIGTTERK